MADENNIAVNEAETESKWALRGRLRSRAAWASVAGLLVLLFGALHVYDKIGITSDLLKDILYAIGSVLTAFGVFNDPTSKERF